MTTGLYFVDSGIGNKGADKFRDIYGIENSGAGTVGRRASMMRSPNWVTAPRT